MPIDLPPFLRKVVDATITERCASRFLDELDLFSDAECVKLAASKGVGLAIVAGSAIMKVPQIINILPGDTTGLSLARFVIEAVTFTVVASYNFLKGYPVSTWGENLFLLMQNYVIIFLIVYHRGQINSLTLISTVVYVAGTSLILSGSLEALPPFSIALMSGETVATKFALAGPGVLKTIFQLCTIVMVPISRVLQIYKSWSEGRTGQLSLPTSFLAAAGAVVRALTILKEVPDAVLLLAVTLSATLNNIVLFQIIYYNYISGSRRDVKEKGD
eukprot:CAMPEP_0114519964 /NCGR_PEP_ID=MMETSP0109-20121206/19306_1 /TAXON_ID=29199 /ORGANISM="Chlorarachnion reptans, Strain CCCM449" /LENGTH=273 /DNA_ID=CAMNT_0001700783 /DNA_START=149 /DNA_END=970 /DNA_ORIENTATION=-